MRRCEIEIEYMCATYSVHTYNDTNVYHVEYHKEGDL